MKFFTIYNANTGEIKNSGTCIDIDIQLVPDDCLIAEIKSNPLTQYIKNKNVKNIPVKPNFECYFDFASESWIPLYDKQVAAIRAHRNSLLTNSDWTQLPDVALTSKVAWSIYRQALRDVTSQPDPFNIVWPTPPTA